ncbi:uncharacterized protein LOC135115638 [Scylla paramamosain]|uniref:uncharacterized protein LOC135115638 n=1 Tax=Scylla paramamosain TaxID=85552 RepID=UPI0030834E71
MDGLVNIILVCVDQQAAFTKPLVQTFESRDILRSKWFVYQISGAPNILRPICTQNTRPYKTLPFIKSPQHHQKILPITTEHHNTPQHHSLHLATPPQPSPPPHNTTNPSLHLTSPQHTPKPFPSPQHHPSLHITSTQHPFPSPLTHTTPFPPATTIFSPFQQLLCAVLQVVATLALSPHHHPALLAAKVPDALTQLILPSDEWFYTNHSTRHARYVKHHAARTLVYLGLQHRVNHRVNVYDLLLDEAPPPTPLGETSEDDYIMMTSAPPPLVTAQDSKRVLGMSVEGMVLHTLRSLENVPAPCGVTPTSEARSTTPLEWLLDPPPQDPARGSGTLRGTRAGGVAGGGADGGPSAVLPAAGAAAGAAPRHLPAAAAAQAADIDAPPHQVEVLHLALLLDLPLLSGALTHLLLGDGRLHASQAAPRQPHAGLRRGVPRGDRGALPSTTAAPRPPQCCALTVRRRRRATASPPPRGAAAADFETTLAAAISTTDVSVTLQQLLPVRLRPADSHNSISSSSKATTPSGSPSIFPKRSFRFSSLHKKRSKSVHDHINSSGSNAQHLPEQAGPGAGRGGHPGLPAPAPEPALL